MNKEMATTLSQLADSDAKHVHLYRFIGGVMYALEEYNRLATATPKPTQLDQFYSDELKHLLNAIQGAVAPPPNWLRGFFYNAAVMRLDAAWERSLRVILQDTTTKSLKKLYIKLRESEPALTLPEYDNSACRLVRNEVNALKHQVKGPAEDIREKPEDLRNGLEQLLSLLNRRVNSVRSNNQLEPTA